MRTVHFSSIAELELEPEPVERQHFARAGAEIFWSDSGSGSRFVNSYKILQKALDFSYKNLKLSLNQFFVAIYFEETFDDHFF
jgi:hypothetical protein